MDLLSARWALRAADRRRARAIELASEILSLARELGEAFPTLDLAAHALACIDSGTLCRTLEGLVRKVRYAATVLAAVKAASDPSPTPQGGTAAGI